MCLNTHGKKTIPRISDRKSGYLGHVNYMTRLTVRHLADCNSLNLSCPASKLCTQLPIMEHGKITKSMVGTLRCSSNTANDLGEVILSFSDQK